MSQIAFILGPIVFRDFEESAGISFGGEQRLAVHHLPGGERIIDALGRNDAEIVLTGAFSGQDATLRARLVDELRASGAILPLTWDVFFYSAIVRDFQAEYRNPYWIPFRLACTVLRDESAAVVEATLSLAESVLGDVAQAAAQGVSGIDFGPAQAACNAPGATTIGTSAYGDATASFGMLSSQIDAGVTASGASLGSASSVLGSTVDPGLGAAALGTATASAGQLGSLAAARAFIGRASANLANAGT